MEMIIKHFEDSDGFGKMQIKRKLKELADPSLTFLIEPTVKAKTRGRPSQKLDKSTLQVQLQKNQKGNEK